MTVFDCPDFDRHESVHLFHEPDGGLRSIIAIHSTTLGPAAGGCRRWEYVNEAAAISDALRLSRGMSYKNALAGLPFGGGKAIILAEPRRSKPHQDFLTFGRFVDSLKGRYVTAEDVGVSVDDMQCVRQVTPFVSGLPQVGDGAGGNPSPWTALGVYLSIRAAVELTAGTANLRGLTIAVQGVGQVGYQLCRLLHEEGARLIVADVNPANAHRAARDFGAQATAPDEITAADADILSPCALGGTLNEDTVSRVSAGVVAGAANNQLATREDGVRLHERGILFLPDYVINAGGIIAVAREYLGGSTRDDLRIEVERIPDRLLELLQTAREQAIPPSDAADRMARDVIEKAGIRPAAGNG